MGKVYHKKENYEEAKNCYFQTTELNPANMAATFCLAKIHYLYGNLNAVDEALTRLLSHNTFKDCYEAL